MFPKPHPVDSTKNLRDRVERLFKAPIKDARPQLGLGIDSGRRMHPERFVDHPTKTLADFLDFISAALPSGDVYLFGGVLRDLALFGRSGFNSDIDMVAEGDWDGCVAYMSSLGAIQNKFGGYRLIVAGWPIDIWNAKETWAIKQGLVEYRGISSLTQTTVLNWDAILMNWRTRSFVHREDYIDSINQRVLDIVLESNPNPLGMAVRVFRHLCSKDAKRVTSTAATYLRGCAELYSFEELKSAELRSYGNSAIERSVHGFFRDFGTAGDGLSIQSRYGIASDIVKREFGLI